MSKQLMKTIPPYNNNNNNYSNYYFYYSSSSYYYYYFDRQQHLITQCTKFTSQLLSHQKSSVTQERIRKGLFQGQPYSMIEKGKKPSESYI